MNAHVTFLAPRISESVVEVRFDNNDFVKKGDLVVVLDDAIEKVRVAQASAALELARNEEAAQLAASRLDLVLAQACSGKPDPFHGSILATTVAARAGRECLPDTGIGEIGPPARSILGRADRSTRVRIERPGLDGILDESHRAVTQKGVETAGVSARGGTQEGVRRVRGDIAGGIRRIE